ncbi:redoxin domain-containing protein [Parasporobacterium paucivorans]|uniref:Cytochrome c-type biogenesis protein n=1 Tax=Parasporobacterium paucivorans DSM 15970 TaxID=1122934 RepID=A0A1M6EP15_9FIRM|nr:cytochrome c biogenesis protein CcdA [Parasporobacterium paucivorans]SHI87088.1 cytochrome c-type biogenesis protein [Parasporobacterium paucivorans DSM 15970]
MFEGIASGNISFLLVFIEGVFSFFSPCVLPLIPVYMSYLAGNTKEMSENGIVTYNRKKMIWHTLFFVLGISIAFFILGMSFTALGNFFNSRQILFTRVGGIIIVLLGLFQIGFFDFKFMQKDRKFHLNLGSRKVNPLIALVMGFTFSFAWTPCVGPALSSVLIMASGASSRLTGNLLVTVYAAGFLIPFILLGLFTTQALGFLRNKKKALKYTIKAGGLILILMGIMTFTGWMNGVSGYLNQVTTTEVTDTGETNPTGQTESESTVGDSKSASNAIPAFDFTLTDQYGNTHTLSDYKGKIVFLNFWATWCPPCKQEMPDIQALYEEFNLNRDDIIILGVANPRSQQYPNNQDVTKGEVVEFLADAGYTFPVVFDETGEVSADYSISAFPTTFMIDKQGNVAGYVPGMMTKEIMKSVIQQTMDAAN